MSNFITETVKREFYALRDGKAAIRLNDGGHLIIGPRGAFDTLGRHLDTYQTAQTNSTISGLRYLASGGMSRLRYVVEYLGGCFVYDSRDESIIARALSYVQAGLLTAQVLPLVQASETSGNLKNLEIDPSKLQGSAEVIGLDIDPDNTRFEDLDTFKKKLFYVLKRCPNYIKKKDIAKAFKEAMTATAIISIVVVLAAWAASHFYGVGFAIDAVLLAIGWIMIGWGIFKALGGLIKTLKMVKNAENMRDLDAAAKKLAKTLVSLGVDTFIGLLTRGAGKLKRRTNAKRQPIAAPAPPKTKTNPQKKKKEDEGTAIVAPPKRVRCFENPNGLDAKEFDRQLLEQQTTINNMTADDMSYAHWVLEKAGGTKNLRVPSAQVRHRKMYVEMLKDSGLSKAEIAQRMDSRHATHFLDMVAGGDPTKFSIDSNGNPILGKGDVNSHLGGEWTRKGRAGSLRDEAARMRQTGHSNHKMNVELKRCK